jgi:hypothetical protein
MDNFKGIRPGDRVTFRTAHGARLTGRAQRLLCFPSHVVVTVPWDARGARPIVVDARNYIAHRPSTR